MVPVDALPPATVFTSHDTDEFDDPLTVATNICVAPARTLAEPGVTETVTLAGVVGCVGAPGFVDLKPGGVPLSPHPPRDRSARAAKKWETRRIICVLLWP